MHFHFPVVIIDEDFRSENTSGLGIRALAEAIEKEGFEVLGVTSYGDLSSSRSSKAAPAFILSIDDEEFTPGPELDPAVLNLRKFIRQEIRFKQRRDPDLPVRRDAHLAPHSERHPARAARLHPHVRGHAGVRRAPHHPRGQEPTSTAGAAVLPRAGHYAQDGSYSWHCPGHSGGVAFLKSPVGQMFHQFFGENMLRADVCNAVDELGQLLDHTGPVAALRAQRGAHLQRRPLLLRHQRHLDQQQDGLAPHVAPGDIVVVDRNCHKSILHAIIMTGAMPVFLTPTRNHYGIIGPIPLSEFKPENIQKQDRRQSRFAQGVKRKVKPRILTLTQSTYDGVLYNVETLKDARRLDRHAALRRSLAAARGLPRFLRHMHAIGKTGRAQGAMVFATQSTHKLLAGMSQASQILVQDSQTRKLDRTSSTRPT
jgi:arginine decarboxylase